MTPEERQAKRDALLRRKELLERRRQLLDESGFQTQRESAPQARAKAFTGGLRRGGAGLVGLPVDTSTNLMNLGIAGYGTAMTAAGRPDLAPDLISQPYMGSERLAQGMDAFGLNTQNPRPEDPTARGLHTTGTLLGGSLLPVKAPTMRAGFQPGQTALSAGGGGAAGFFSEDPGVIGLGSMAPGMTGLAASRAAQGMFGQTQAGRQAKENVPLYRQAGTTPTVGQAIESPFVLSMEEVLSKLPGGHRPLLGKYVRQQEDIGTKVGKQGSAEAAGRAIEFGISDFYFRTGRKFKELNDNLVSLVGADTRIAPSNTLKTLDELIGRVSEAKGAVATISSQKLRNLRNELIADMGVGGDLPVQDLRILRTRLGSMMERTGEDFSKAELQQVYRGMSNDLYEAALKADGGKAGKAVAAWTRQNKYWSARQERVDTALDRVLGRTREKLPEEVFAAAAPKNMEQVNLLRQVMRSLVPEERQAVSQAIIGRLGRASPQQQSDIGDVFSTEVFLKNWNKLSPGARAQLIPNQKVRSDLETVAKVAFKMKEAARTGEEFAGRFGSLSQVILAGIVGGAIWKGGVAGGVGAIGSILPAIRVSGNLLTNDKFVGWLAGSTKPVNPQQHAQRLAVIYNQSDTETRADLRDMMNSANKFMDMLGKPQRQSATELLGVSP